MTALTTTDLAAELGCSSNDPALESCLSVGKTLVEQLLDGEDAPGQVLRAAELATAAAEYRRRNAPNGYTNDLPDGGAGLGIPGSTDVTRAARALLTPWLLPAIG
jgi:hypothetical protein